MADLERLIEAARRGDLDAYGEIVRRFQDMAVAYAFGVLGDFHLAEDAAQEAFLEALPILDRVYSAAAFPAWLRRLVFKHCDRLTRRHRPDQVSLDSLSQPPASTSQDPVAALEAATRRRLVQTEVRSLPEQERLVVSLFYMGQHTHNEIAGLLGIPPTTVNNRLRSARRRLQQRMTTMAQQTLRGEAPSHDSTFHSIVDVCAAAERGDLDRVEEILKRDPALLTADHPRHLGKTRRHALHFAAEAGHLQVVRLLLEAGGDPLWGFFHNYHVASPLTLARERGHYLVVDLMDREISRRLDADSQLLSAVDEEGNTLLHKAVYHRHRPLVLELLRRGAKVDAANNRGQRPIHLALYSGMGGPGAMLRDPYYDVAALLLGHGTEGDIWVASAMGDTPAVRRHLDENASLANWRNGARRYPGGADYPLAIAAHHGHDAVVRLLLDAGADPDIENDNEFRENEELESGVPLVFSIARGHLEIANLLLDRGARCDRSKIHSGPNVMAVAFGCRNQPLIDRIIASGGRPLLGHYVEQRDYLLVGELLDRCAHSPHQPGSDREVVHELLIAAVVNCDTHVVGMCLRHSPELPTGLGRWGHGSLGLLHQLARKAYVKRGQPVPTVEVWEPVLVRLLDYGVDVNDHDETGVTALHLLANAQTGWEACETTLAQMAKRLVDAGADLNSVDSDDLKSTPLGWAAHFGRVELVECLLAAGADLDLPRQADRRPLSLAQAQGFPEITGLLKG